MERYFEFSNYRNLGFKAPEKLIINSSLKKGEIGDLIILIGPNNSGKSNVLSGICAFKEQKIDKKRDKTTFDYTEAYSNPTISLVTKDGNNVYSVSLSANTSGYIKSAPQNYKFTVESIKQACTIINDNITGYYSSTESQTLALASEILKGLNAGNTNVSSVMPDFTKMVIRIFSSKNSYRSFQNIIKGFSANKKLYSALEALIASCDSAYCENSYRSTYKIKLVPDVFLYEDKKISHDKLHTSYSCLESSTIFKTILNSINCSCEEINNAYKIYEEQARNKAVLNKLAFSLNKKLKKISADFNRLYCLEENSYSFEFDLDSSYVYFNIYKDGQPVMLDYQSTGFRWFFDLYFNVLCQNVKEHAGNIIIMDEPATNLHVKGQIELRKFLKDFARKNDIVIILATHSPFLIDADYFDELRVVTPVEGKAVIQNDFSTIDQDDPDALLPIKESLTIKDHIVLDPNKKVVFVEGITDYNYLTAFKLLLNFENVSFLPVHGVGRSKDEQAAISKKLIQIRKNNPFFLADGDKAGKEFKNTNKSSELEVVTLDEIDPSFKTIESLFTNEDQNLLGLIDENGKFVKHSHSSSIFKKMIFANKISEQTINNFKKVFSYIMD